MVPLLGLGSVCHWLARLLLILNPSEDSRVIGANAHVGLVGMGHSHLLEITHGAASHKGLHTGWGFQSTFILHPLTLCFTCSRIIKIIKETLLMDNENIQVGRAQWSIEPSQSSSYKFLDLVGANKADNNAIPNTGHSTETVEDATDEGDEELIHENTAESKMAWENKLNTLKLLGTPRPKLHCAFHDNSTPNLVYHARRCKAAVSKDDDKPKLVQSNLTSFVQGSTYTAACLLDTLSWDIKDIYNIVKLCVAKLLQGVRGQIHVAQDGWAVLQKLSLLRLVVVWVADAKVQVMMTVMIHLKKSHTGTYLVKMINKSLYEFGVVDKLLLLPGNNASSNIRMACSLKGARNFLVTTLPAPRLVFCVLDIYLILQTSFLQDDDNSWLEDNEDNDLDAEEQDLLDELTLDAQEANKDAILEDLLEAVDNLEALEDEDGNLERNAVMKIFKLSHQIFNNGAMQYDLHEECANNGIRINDMIRALKPILTMLTAAMITLSKFGVPLIHHVLPMFDNMIDKLDKVLCKYYSKTDKSYMYCIAMIMYLAYSMEYFHEQKWEPEWIEHCFEIVYDIWQKHYKPASPPTDMENQLTNDAKEDDMLSNYFKKQHRNSSKDTLEKYLHDPVLEDLDNPLHYWLSLLDPCNRSGKVTLVTPKGALAQMALDFLLVPATSTDIEHLFSHGGLNVMKWHHNLSAESTIDQTVLNSWIKHPGLINDNELMEFFSNKSKRPNNGGKKQMMED
ncbi:ribonuclease H-like domain-containing protein [Armillaria nabsnona]|nr:ribonuclease H-like domain-containing protein [Armillaria nabsnona]